MDANCGKTKQAFRKKMKEARDNSEIKSEICLAYDIMVNRGYCQEFDKNKEIYALIN